MKVLFISHEATRTGAPIALLQQLRHITACSDDIKPEVLLLDGGDMVDEFKALCPTYKGWRDYTSMNRILRRLKVKRVAYPYLHLFSKGDVDCIYANTVASFKAACHLKAKLGIPLIGHVHESENLMFQHPWAPGLLPSFDAFVTVSELAARNLTENYAISPNRVAIQHPVSVWVDRFMKGDVDVCPYDFREDALLVGLFCNETWFKSLDMVPGLVKLFRKQHPDVKCRFVIVGDFCEITRHRLDYELRLLGCQEDVIFAPVVDNPLCYHARFDMFLLLSREESFSLVAQEAALMETPIIGFQGVTGAAEWVRDDAGILVPYLDMEEIGHAISRLALDPQLRKTYGQTAKQRVMKMYTIDSRLEVVMSVIRKYGKQ